MTLTNLEILFDRCEVKSLPTQIQKFIIENQLISSTNNEFVSFCGLILLESKKYIFFPLSSDRSIIDSNPYHYSNLLISSLNKYFNSTKNIVFHPDDELQESDLLGLDQLNVRKNIIDDYLNKGLIISEINTLKKNRGKIDWRATLNKSLIFPDQNNCPIYIDFYSKNRINFDYEITKIHVGVLQKIFLDNVFFDNRFKKLPYDIKHADKSKLSINSQIKLLKSELKNQYKDRSIRVIKLLINFLSNFHTEKQGTNIIGVTKFHCAWEHMLLKIFNNTISLNGMLPKPRYISTIKDMKHAIKDGMRTDIVVIDEIEKSISILDAKYYKATNSQNSPGWGDLVKQFFYEKALKTLPQYSDYTVKNILIFPGSVHNFEKVKMATVLKPIPKFSHFIFKEVIKFSLRDSILKKVIINSDYVQFHDKDFPPLDCKYTPPLELLDLYLHNKKVNVKFV